jgi:hypothetical protein
MPSAGAIMKKMANFLILLGSGLAAFGISAFTGNFSSDWARPEMPNAWSGSLGWSLKNQIEIVVGVVSRAFGLILRRCATNPVQLIENKVYGGGWSLMRTALRCPFPC